MTCPLTWRVLSKVPSAARAATGASATRAATSSAERRSIMGPPELCGIILPRSLLLEYNRVSFVEPGENFGAAAIRNAGRDGHFFLPIFGFWIGNEHECVLVVVPAHGLLGHAERVVMLGHDDLGVRGHQRFDLAAWIVAGNAHFQRGDVVLLHAQRRDFGHLAVEGLVGKRFDVN